MTATRGIPLTEQLGLLEGAGLIQLAATDPELEYLFRHVLIQDAAYESLLKQERRELHASVAASLESLYGDHLAELAPVLAHHWERAGDRGKALRHLMIAAQHARERFARHEARHFYARAVDLLAGDDLDTAERALRARANLGRVEASYDFTPAGQVLAILEVAMKDASAVGDPALMAQTHLLTALTRTLIGEHVRGSAELHAALAEARRLADEAGDEGVRMRADALLAVAKYQAAELTEAVELFESTIPRLAAAGDPYQASLLAGHLGMSYGRLGDFERSLHWTDEATRLGIESGDPDAQLDADLARAHVEALRGNPELAIEHASRAAETADRVDNKACAIVARTVIGGERLRLGDASSAIQVLEETVGLAEYCQLVPVKVQQAELLLASARARTGSGIWAFEHYEHALELARRVDDRFAQAELFEQRARDRIASGNPGLALPDLESAAQIFAQLQAKPDLERIQNVEAELRSAPA
jgi:tetratricopeptide (TPR) repeat protein